MKNWSVGDLALVIAQVDEISNEYGHIYHGDVVTIASINNHKVQARTRGGELIKVWAECRIEAPDGTEWSAVFCNLKKVDPPDEAGDWEQLEGIWEPAESCETTGQRGAVCCPSDYSRELK